MRFSVFIVIFSCMASIELNAAAPQSSMKADPQSLILSPWSAAISYGASTDLAVNSSPRAYYQGVSASLNYTVAPKWTVSAGLDANFTTINGQIDKKQEESSLEAAGVTPTLGLGYTPGNFSPWFVSANASALLDSASRQEGYVALFSLSAGGTFGYFKDRLGMTHTVRLSELLNRYETASTGAPNQASSVGYEIDNTLNFSKHFVLSAGFGIRQTRYLDGFWDYSYSSSLTGTFVHDSWSASVSTTNGGYTEDGRVALWYVDQYRRIVSLSMAYQF